MNEKAVRTDQISKKQRKKGDIIRSTGVHILSIPQETPRPSTRINTAIGRRARSGAAFCLSVVANIIKARIAVPTNSEVNKGIGDMYSIWNVVEKRLVICQGLLTGNEAKRPAVDNVRLVGPPS